MFKLILVGAGQLGSRYLQGIVISKSQLEITVVDASITSLEIARARWIEAGGEHSHHRISWESDIPSELKCIDLALIATTAKGRADLVNRISSQMAVRYWVLEKVLAQSVEQLDIISRATAQSHGVWVNTTRRMQVWHNSLKKALQSNGIIKASYSGGLWGLCCNSIHFIDLISWWGDEKLDSIDTSRLDRHWFESKRAGYFEVTGRLVANFSKGSILTLEAGAQAKIQPLLIDRADAPAWKIDEVNGTAVSVSGVHLDGCIEFQSQISGRLVDDLLLRGQCDLTTLDESKAMHAIFLEAMLKHWNLSHKRNDVCVPIT
jgi:hypothetical protein